MTSVSLNQYHYCIVFTLIIEYPFSTGSHIQTAGWPVPQPVGGASFPPLPMPHPLPNHQPVPLPPPPPDQLMVST